MENRLNEDQQSALAVLNRDENVFLTGAAGSGKSFLLSCYLREREQKIPVLASTGAAAILVGGRTFHSFFGLGILQGGILATVDRAAKNTRVSRRIKKTNAVIIDEVSMISGPTLRAAEQICRCIRESSAPWGGMRIIVVGDFAQLPPVNPFSQQKEWAFLDEAWSMSGFKPVILQKVMRTSDPKFLEVLNQVRTGDINDETSGFLNSRMNIISEGRDCTRLFSHRNDVEKFNLERLAQIKNKEHLFHTSYSGKLEDIETFKKHSPISETICLKEKAFVMLRQNDPEGRWVNGSLGRIVKIADTHISVKLRAGPEVDVEKTEFTLLNAEGNPVVTATNFPLSLAWAMTIHKAQGTTLDGVLVDLRKIWEPGQAYVALSRVKDPNGLYLEGWNKQAIFCDPQVTKFHQSLSNNMAL